MSQQGTDGDFTVCDTALLTGSSATTSPRTARGGTNTRQRNPRHLFTWLEDTYGHPPSSPAPPLAIGRYPRELGPDKASQMADQIPDWVARRRAKLLEASRADA
jgi:hypothetical protein